MNLPTADNPALVLVGDALATLRRLPAGCVHCCVTSPPYWGLRDYGTGTWEGGDAACEHKRPSQAPQLHVGSDGKIGKNNTNWDHRNETAYKDGTCGKCGARRTDQQLGSEPSPDCGTHGPPNSVWPNRSAPADCSTAASPL